MGHKIKRCAIYTRKSSEDGLDQSFNSLDAQREACHAYVLSQTGEGWEASAHRFDDGGFSGGNTNRPGLQALLSDIQTGKIDIVVVYKIDRLTRSLADFARIVEVFERHDCSFVSVTQSFNTTGSMGKLMLNVLLSFAQFEREVTGERIRDKVAASKAKGMWMGGVPPLGYDLPKDGARVLRVNEEEAERVRFIFNRYLELSSVHSLLKDLKHREIVSKFRMTLQGRAVGGKPFSRSTLYYLLQNPVYLGKIKHKEVVHDGGHEAVVEDALFQKVQLKLDAQNRHRRVAARRRSARSPLAGKLFDAAGDPMSPTNLYRKNGKTYRYYVSAPLQRGVASSSIDRIKRVSGVEIEKAVANTVTRYIPNISDPLLVIKAVRLTNEGLYITIRFDPFEIDKIQLANGDDLIDRTDTTLTGLTKVRFTSRRSRKQIIPSSSRQPQLDPVLIKALRRAHSMLKTKRGMPIVESAPNSPYDRNILRMAFLAPDIQRDILAGRHPAHLNVQTSRKLTIPLDWQRQREVLRYIEPGNA